MSQPFESLREPLLQAGVAPRHVKRYLAELADHAADIIVAEISRGATDAEAEQAVRARMGSDRELVASAVQQLDLRAFPARHPWVFGLGGLAGLIGFVLLSVLALALWTRGVMPLLLDRVSAPVLWGPAKALAAVNNYLLPFIVGAGLIAAAWRQRITSPWLASGLVLLALAGGTMNFNVIPGEGTHGDLQVGFGLTLSYPFPESLIRCLLNLAVLLGGYGAMALWVKRWRRTPSAV